MPDPTLTEIVVLLDRSGSMASVQSDMERGYDAFIAKQRAVAGRCVVTLVQFDSGGIDTVYEATDVAAVPPMVLDPRGSTPLLDALGTTITRTGERFDRTPDERRPGRVLFLILTDGFENASHEFTKTQIKAMIEHQTAAYQWVFSYLGANVDAFAESAAIGIVATQAAAYHANTGGVAAAFAVASDSAAAYRGGSTYTFSAGQRQVLDDAGKSGTIAVPVDLTGPTTTTAWPLTGTPGAVPPVPPNAPDATP